MARRSGWAGNGIREYARLGLLDELAAASTFPTELIYRHWQDGSRIAAHPVRKDDWYEKQFGAPWFGIHRADLQMPPWLPPSPRASSTTSWRRPARTTARAPRRPR